jgi:hypothetical protein
MDSNSRCCKKRLLEKNRRNKYDIYQTIYKQGDKIEATSQCQPDQGASSATRMRVYIISILQSDNI